MEVGSTDKYTGLIAFTADYGDSDEYPAQEVDVRGHTVRIEIGRHKLGISFPFEYEGLSPEVHMDELAASLESVAEEIAADVCCRHRVSVGDIVRGQNSLSHVPVPGETHVVPLSVRFEGRAEVHADLTIERSQEASRKLVGEIRDALGQSECVLARQRFRSAMQCRHPVERYMGLYKILLRPPEDRIEYADALLQCLDPSLPVTAGYNGRSETILTKLRNEIPHNRAALPGETRKDMEDSLPLLTDLVALAIEQGEITW